MGAKNHSRSRNPTPPIYQNTNSRGNKQGIECQEDTWKSYFFYKDHTPFDIVSIRYGTQIFFASYIPGKKSVVALLSFRRNQNPPAQLRSPFYNFGIV